MHGAGVIEDLEEQRIDGILRSYYVLRIPIGDLKIMLATDSVDDCNMRRILPPNDIADLIDGLAGLPLPPVSANWSQRYKDHLAMMKSGRLADTAVVFRSLYSREKQRGLSSVEKKMLTTVKKILLSEIMLSYNIERLEAEQMLEKSLKC